MRPLVDPEVPLKQDPRGRRFDLVASVAVFAAALTVRLLYVHQLWRTPLFSQLLLDPLYYHEWARRIAAGDWLSGHEVFEQSPLYAYLLAGIYRLFGEGLLVPRLVQAVLGAAGCVIVFWIARHAFGRPASLAAGLLASIYAPGIFYDGMIMKTGCAVLLTAAMTLAILRSEGGRRQLVFLSGLLLGLDALVRDNMILLAPLLALWFAADVWLRPVLEAGRIREAAARVALFAAGVAAAIAPVTLRNGLVAGEWVLLTAGGGEVLYIGNNPEADGKYSPPPFVRATSGIEHEDFRVEAARRLGHPLTRREASNYWIGEALRWIAGNPGDFLVLMVRKAAIFLNAYELPDNQNFYHHRVFVPLLRPPMPTWAVLLPLAMAGFAFSMRQWRSLLPLYVIAAGCFGAVLVFFNFARFRMPIVPILLAFAGEAIVESALALKRMEVRSLVAASVAAVAGLALALLPPGSDLLHRGQSSAQLADLFLRAGRTEEARAEAGRGIDLLERVYAEAGGRPGRGGHGVAPRDDPGRPPLGASYYGVLMDAYYVTSRVERAAGDREGSGLWLERAALAAPDPDVGFDVLTAHGEALLAAGRPGEALAEIEKVRPIEPHDLPLAVLAGRALHALGRDREAIATVDAALAAPSAIDPLDLSDANFLLGLACHDLGEVERMRFHFREALAKNPGHPRAAWMRRILEEGEPQGIR